MTADVGGLAEDAGQVWHTEGNESDWTADGHGTGHKEHYGQELKGLAEV